MKEGTPLSQEEVDRRPAQFRNALTQITLAEQVLAEAGGVEHVLKGCQDGKEYTLFVNKQVIQAMKGGASRMYSDLVDMGEKPYADQTLEIIRGPKQ